MDRNQKEALVAQIRSELLQASVVVVIRQVGLTVAEASDLRGKMREVNANFKVLKNTLAQIAVQGTPLAGISEMLTGPTALAYSVDPINAAKVVVKYASGNEKLSVVGGSCDGKILSVADIKALATLPSLDELRSTMIAIISAPATKLAIISQEPAARLARVLSKRS